MGHLISTAVIVVVVVVVVAAVLGDVFDFV